MFFFVCFFWWKVVHYKAYLKWACEHNIFLDSILAPNPCDTEVDSAFCESFTSHPVVSELVWNYIGGIEESIAVAVVCAHVFGPSMAVLQPWFKGHREELLKLSVCSGLCKGQTNTPEKLTNVMSRRNLWKVYIWVYKTPNWECLGLLVDACVTVLPILTYPCTVLCLRYMSLFMCETFCEPLRALV